MRELMRFYDRVIAVCVVILILYTAGLMWAYSDILMPQTLPTPTPATPVVGAGLDVDVRSYTQIDGLLKIYGDDWPLSGIEVDMQDYDSIIVVDGDEALFKWVRGE